MNTQPPDREHASAVVHGRYKVLRELGRGGFGSVYLAQDTLLERHVAMKVMSGFGNMFTALTEVTLLASLPPHPNICPYQRTLTVNGSPTIIMPYAHKGSMGEAIHELSTDPGRVIEFALQAAAGLNQVHAFELIHGDIKPQNLLLFDRGRLAVADFGLALHNSRTQYGRVGGTQAYLPPDGEDFEELGRGADWYAWALAFIEASLGYRPWKRGADALESLEAAGAPVAHSSGLIVRLARLLRVLPQERENVAQELVRELGTAYLELTGSPAPAQPPLTARPKDVTTYIPGLHGFDLAGGAFGPTVLLVRSVAAMSESGLDTTSVLAIRDESERPANQASFLASSIVTYGRLVDVLLENQHDNLKPLIAETWSEMGLTYACLGDLPGAVEAHIEALRTLDQLSPVRDNDKINRKVVGIALRLAETYSELGAFDQARVMLESVIERATMLGMEFELKLTLAKAQFDLGRHELASQMYSELIARAEPGAPYFQLARLYYERALCMLQLHRLQEAEVDVKRTLALISSEKSAETTESATGLPPIPHTPLTRQLPLSLKLLGMVFTDSGKHDEAMEAYERAIRAFAEFGEEMSETELKEHIASVELSMSFSLYDLGDTAAAERVLRRCIESRRKLLAAGHDASAVGLANSLLAMTKQRISSGEHLEARSAAAECLRLARTLAATGSRYNVHEIALECLVIILDTDDNTDEANCIQGIRWALAELDAMENISGPLIDGSERQEQRARLLINMANYVGADSQRLLILDEAYKLVATPRGPTHAIAPLACEILLKSAATKSRSGDRSGALADAQAAVRLSRKTASSTREVDGAVSASYDLLLANSLMLSATFMQDGGVSAHEGEPSGAASAAAESLSVLRAINADYLEAYQCGQAAQTLGVGSNYLAPDKQRDASDGMLSFRMSVLALHKAPSRDSLQELSQIARLASARCLSCDDVDGAAAVVREVQGLQNSVSFPETIRNVALNSLNELATYLAHRVVQHRARTTDPRG